CHSAEWIICKTNLRKLRQSRKSFPQNPPLNPISIGCSAPKEVGQTNGERTPKPPEAVFLLSGSAAAGAKRFICDSTSRTRSTFQRARSAASADRFQATGHGG